MRIAIIVTGVQDSGKTSTLRGLLNNFSKEPFRTRATVGWRKIFFNSKFRDLNLIMYCIASSCSESNSNIEERLSKVGLPEALWIAIQSNGDRSERYFKILDR